MREQFRVEMEQIEKFKVGKLPMAKDATASLHENINRMNIYLARQAGMLDALKKLGLELKQISVSLADAINEKFPKGVHHMSVGALKRRIAELETNLNKVLNDVGKKTVSVPEVNARFPLDLALDFDKSVLLAYNELLEEKLAGKEGNITKLSELEKQARKMHMKMFVLVTVIVNAVVISVVYNLFRLSRHLMTVRNYRTLHDRSFTEWTRVSGVQNIA